MKFPYARIGSFYMPVIPVTLSLGDNCVVTEALVDSGAASCIFDAQFARALGIENLEENGIQLEFEGISGHCLVGYQHVITLEVGGHRFPNVPIAFSQHMPDNAVNILGQQGFFEICPIKFTYLLAAFSNGAISALMAPAAGGRSSHPSPRKGKSWGNSAG